MSGDGLVYSKTESLTKGQFLVSIFNEQIEKKLSDSEIVERIQEEFPICKTDYHRFISQYRNRYNRGEWGCQCGNIPENLVPEYREGKAVLQENKPGPAPRSAWEEPEREDS